MGALTLPSEQAQQLDRPAAGAAEPVRHVRVELPATEPDPAKWEVDIAYLTAGT
jgi:hypothetical protein